MLLRFLSVTFLALTICLQFVDSSKVAGNPVDESELADIHAMGCGETCHAAVEAGVCEGTAEGCVTIPLPSPNVGQCQNPLATCANCTGGYDEFCSTPPTSLETTLCATTYLPCCQTTSLCETRFFEAHWVCVCTGGHPPFDLGAIGDCATHANAAECPPKGP
jgi:hypothetical protein